MKILYVITQAEEGGAQKYVLDLAQNFKGIIAAGSEGDYLFLKSSSLNIPFFKLKFLRRNINPIKDALALAELYFLIKKISPDIVHANSSKAGILGSIAGKLAGKKVIFTAHGFQFLEPKSAWKNFLFLLIEKFAGAFRDLIITVSEFDRKAALSLGLCEPGKILTIHNGLKHFHALGKEEARKQLQLQPKNFIIGTIANHYYTKGLDLLLEAIATIPEEIKFQSVIIGTGPETENLSELRKKLKLETKVQFIPHIQEAASLLPAFDLFVLPSRKEGLPYVLLEALFCKVPIVATHVGGIPEIIGENGIVVQPNAHDLALGITKLIKQEQLRIKFAQNSSQNLADFSLEIMNQKTLQAYKKALRLT